MLADIYTCGARAELAHSRASLHRAVDEVLGVLESIVDERGMSAPGVAVIREAFPTPQRWLAAHDVVEECFTIARVLDLFAARDLREQAQALQAQRTRYRYMWGQAERRFQSRLDNSPFVLTLLAVAVDKYEDHPFATLDDVRWFLGTYQPVAILDWRVTRNGRDPDGALTSTVVARFPDLRFETGTDTGRREGARMR